MSRLPSETISVPREMALPGTTHHHTDGHEYVILGLSEHPQHGGPVTAVEGFVYVHATRLRPKKLTRLYGEAMEALKAYAAEAQNEDFNMIEGDLDQFDDVIAEMRGEDREARGED